MVFRHIRTILFLLLLIFPLESHSSPISKPFFLMGDGKIKIKNNKNGRTANLSYLNTDGTLNKAAFEKIDFLFAYPASERNEHISMRLIAFLDYFSDQYFPDAWIYMNSGYRSPKYNQNLRKKGRGAAKTSTHIDGMALDFYIDGVNGKEMWELIRKHDCCGAGHYGGKTVHLDSGRPRFWQQSTSKVKTNASAMNRFIYLSTEYDKYKTKSRVRLLFTSISDFGFGVKRKVSIVKDNVEVAKTKLNTKQSCHRIEQRKDARFLYVELPKKLKSGEDYQIKLEFCEKPFEDMPDTSISNKIMLD